MVKKALNETLSKFRRDPLRLIKISLDKMFIGPLKYGRGRDYDAAGYWSDRLSKYGDSLQGPGCEGLSHQENERRYMEVTKSFTDLCVEEGVKLDEARVLEIGPGTGYFTRLLRDGGVRGYVGADITDVCFPKLAAEFPEYMFIKADVTSEGVRGEFDVVIMIDVVVHIMTETKFASAMANVKRCLKYGGVFIVSPVMDKNRRYLFYNRGWSVEDFKSVFPGYVVREYVLLGYRMLAIKKQNG